MLTIECINIWDVDGMWLAPIAIVI